MFRITVAIILLSVSTASAQSVTSYDNCSQGACTYCVQGDCSKLAIPTAPLTPLVVTSPVEIFRLDKGGCLRGPLVIRDVEGKEKFRLTPGTEYPSGCGAQK
jgi:hypothetical protein